MSRPIADYALLGDCHSAALVSTDGSVDWWCAPRFDSRSVFARLLDPEAGHFTVRPFATSEVKRKYVTDTMVLRTTFHTRSGTLCVTDCLALEAGARGHDIGLRSPHILLRLAEVLVGSVELLVEFAPRPEYGLVSPALHHTPGGLRTVGGADTLLLTSDLELHVDHATAGTRVTLEQGERVAFALQHRSGLARTDFDVVDPASRLEDTVAGWGSWAQEHRGYDGPYGEAVARSALVLQALTYQPSGAVVAAPTTSLPEILGGEANCDYRFCWLRDASLTLRALWIAACPDEASRFFDWMASAVGRQPLVALGDSIRERGVLQPIIVTPVSPNEFMLIAGERRWRAAQIAGLSTIPALIDAQADAAVSLQVALIENVVREDLTPIEEARTIVILLDDLGLTAGALAQQLGRSRTDLAHTTRLLDLPDEAIDLIDAGTLTKGHGKALLTEPDHARRRALARQAAQAGWSIRTLEIEIAKPTAAKRHRPDPPPTTPPQPNGSRSHSREPPAAK